MKACAWVEGWAAYSVGLWVSETAVWMASCVAGGMESLMGTTEVVGMAVK